MTILTTIFALYVITADNIIEVGRFKSEAACSAQSDVMRKLQGERAFCMRTEREKP